MRRLLPTRVLTPLLLLALLAVAPLPASAQSKGATNKAKEEERAAFDVLRAADAQLESGVLHMEELEGKIYSLTYRIEKLGTAIVTYADDVDDLEERARKLVIQAYTDGGQTIVASAFSAGSIQEVITSRALFDAAAKRDLSQLDQLAAVSRQMDRLSDDLTVKETEVQLLRAEHEAVVLRLAEVQEVAEAIHAEARAKWATAYTAYRREVIRQAAIAAAQSGGAAAGIPNQTKGTKCPVAGYSYFSNTWGFPRSGGRTHHGTDMMASYNTPLVAMQSGSIRINSHSLGGLQVYIYGDDGITSYYAHLSKYPTGLHTGQRVNKGQIVGYVGDSGNAKGTPHLHLGIITGGIYVNPYPTVRRSC